MVCRKVTDRKTIWVQEALLAVQTHNYLQTVRPNTSKSNLCWGWYSLWFAFSNVDWMKQGPETSKKGQVAAVSSEYIRISLWYNSFVFVECLMFVSVIQRLLGPKILGLRAEESYGVSSAMGIMKMMGLRNSSKHDDRHKNLKVSLYCLFANSYLYL